MLKRIPYQNVVAMVFVLALFMDILDVTIVNVSLFAIATDFNTSLAATTWIVLGYSLSLAVWIPTSGWIGDRFGTKNTFLVALGVFILGSLLCSEARTINQLILFRIIQGVGGGMLTPVGVTLLFRAFPPEQRAKASGILAIPTVLAPALGPVIGGLLTDTVGWKWIFRVNVPVGIFAFAVAFFGLRNDQAAEKTKFDLVGFALSATAFPSLVYALERGAEEGWMSGRIIGVGLLGIVALVLLVMWSLRAKRPLLKLALLKERLFGATNFVSFVSTMAFLGMVFLLPQFLQRVSGLSAFQSGLATFPQAFGVITMSRVASKAYQTVGPRRMLLWSYLGLAVATVPFLFLTVDTNLNWIRLLMFIRGLFLAFSFIPLQAASYARVSPADTGKASAIFSTQRQLGAAMGVAVLSTILLATIPQPFGRGVVPTELRPGFTSAFHWGFAGAIVLTVAAALMSLLVRDADAASTMHAPKPA